MKPKNFALVVLVVAIVGMGLWWFTRSAAAPEKITETPRPVKADAPKPVASPIIAPSITSPAPIPGAVPVSAQPVAVPVAPIAAQPIEKPPADPNVDPQADLKTAIPDIARLTRAGDQLKLYQTYTRPDKLDPKIAQQIAAQQAQTHNFQTPPWDEIEEAEAQSYDELENQIPTFNAAGDEATYRYTRTDAEVPPGTQEPMTLIKINGKWYFNPQSGK